MANTLGGLPCFEMREEINTIIYRIESKILEKKFYEIHKFSYKTGVKLMQPLL